MRFNYGAVGVMVILALVGCGKKPAGGSGAGVASNACASSNLLGSYNDVQGNTFTLAADCTGTVAYNDSSSGWSANFTLIAPITTNSGQFKITITSAQGPNPPAQGLVTLNFQVSGASNQNLQLWNLDQVYLPVVTLSHQ